MQKHKASFELKIKDYNRPTSIEIGTLGGTMRDYETIAAISTAVGESGVSIIKV